MNGRTLALVLLVSLSHAMVHVFELIFPSIEETLAKDWSLDTRVTGLLGTSWAMPFGFGAVAAGWLSDRFGSRIVLLIYLLGCSATCVLVGFASTLPMLFLALAAMGSFASLYHPAGLAYISRLTPSRHLGAALGYHGIFGSLGIATAPFLAGTLLGIEFSWKGVYLSLVPIGIALAVFSACLFPNDRKADLSGADVPASEGSWRGFVAICLVTLLFGIVYRGFVTFLPRYLGDGITASADWQIFSNLSERTMKNYLTGGVLLLGIIGQFVGGWLCGRFRLENLMLGCILAQLPFLLWMGVATGVERLVATGTYSIVHFSMQPVQNSLIARYTPRHRRSLGYGISNLLTFGLGSFGATYSGFIAKDFGVSAIYPSLAIFMVLSAIFGVHLIVKARQGMLPE